jgi:cellulose synthase operon protein C
MSDPALTALRAELNATFHDARMRHMVELGHKARADPKAQALLDAMAGGDAFERRLSLAAQFGRRDGRAVLAAMTDASGTVRALALELVPLACDDLQALEALRIAQGMRREQHLLHHLRKRDRHAVIDLYLDGLATGGDPALFADAVPLASEAGLRRHLARAMERPSHRFWARLARHAPQVLGEVLLARLREVTGEPDPVTRQHLNHHLGWLAEHTPDAAETLVRVLLERSIPPPQDAVRLLVRARPVRMVALLRQHPPAFLPHLLFAKSVAALDAEALTWVVQRDPTLLGRAEDVLETLPESLHPVLARAWCAAVERAPAWGTELLALIQDPAERERVYQRWTVGARSSLGITPIEYVQRLPVDLREREARRHLHEVVELGTRADQRLAYARFLPWEEALAELKGAMGHPAAFLRSVSLGAVLAIPGLRPDAPQWVAPALALVVARKNEQDPVRETMLKALAAWPRRLWRPEHTEALSRVLRDALDAADLSMRTAEAAERLLVRAFGTDPAWGAPWLGTFLKERGGLQDAGLGHRLSDDEVRRAAPHLLALAKGWAERERGGPLLQLAASLGKRAALVPGLSEWLVSVRDATPGRHLALALSQWLSREDRPRFEASLATTLRRWRDRGWDDEIVALASAEKDGTPLHPELVEELQRVAMRMDKPAAGALWVLRSRALKSFDGMLPALLRRDESAIAFPVVRDYLHRRRQDLLGPFLDAPVITGQFATGATRWVLGFDSGFFRWTVAQSAAYEKALARLCADPERDTPTLLLAVTRLAALTWGPVDTLLATADDQRPAAQERALRVMARCDQGQGVPVLLRCLEDSRARIAIYGLRRAFNGMPSARVLALLAEVPLSKVTVAKEVVRLVGELRTEAAYQRLLELDAKPLHRDVRIALLRALWDHLDREETWAVYERAVAGEDAIMASRVGDIPPDRLTEALDARLSALLAKVLARPEPDARIDLLRRAAWLPVKDRERVFLSACGARLASPYDDEVRTAMNALVYRTDERDVPLFERMLEAVAKDRRALSVALNALLQPREHMRPVPLLAVQSLVTGWMTQDPTLAALRVRCAVVALAPPAFASHLDQMGQEGWLYADALQAAQTAVSGLPMETMEAVGDRLARSPSGEARRVGLHCLLRDAQEGRGWTPERLAKLAAFQRDASPLVASVAQFVFPPREMVEQTPGSK